MRIIRFSERAYLPASHEDPANPGVIKKIMLRRGELDGGVVTMVNWATLPLGRSFTPHYHEDMQEVFMMTAGSAHMKSGEQEADVHVGDVIVVEVGEVHEMTNRGNTDVTYLVFGISKNTGGRTVTIDIA